MANRLKMQNSGKMNLIPSLVVSVLLSSSLVQLGTACRRRNIEEVNKGNSAQDLKEVDESVSRELPENLKCKVKFLQRLGWTLEPAKSSGFGDADLPKDICKTKDFQELKSAGKLRAVIDMSSVAGIEHRLNSIAKSEATQCAYRTQLTAALHTAVAKLDRNKNFTFRRVADARHLPKEGILGTTASDYWESESMQMSMYVKPGVSPHAALSVMYDSKHNTYIDCYAGALSVATLAQMELFGKDHFDSVFTANDIFLGVLFTTIDGIDGRGNPLEVKSWWTGDDGKEVPAAGWLQDESAVGSMKLGRHDFIARRGAVVSLLKEEFLDSVVDVNENFIAYAVSDKAQEQMTQLVNSGISMSKHVFDIATSYWMIEAKKVIAEGGDKGKRMQHAVDVFLQTFPEAKNLNYKNESDKLESDAIMNEVDVFVHPLKVKNLKYHVKRLLTVNPRMPYGFKMREMNYSTTMFDRYQKYFETACK